MSITAIVADALQARGPFAEDANRSFPPYQTSAPWGSLPQNQRRTAITSPAPDGRDRGVPDGGEQGGGAG